MRTLIRHGTVVTTAGAFVADVLIEDERIAQVGPQLAAEADRTWDARGKYVIPGGIDVHTHLDMPLGDTVSADDFASGTAAAAFGGTTAIVDFAVQDRGRPMREAWEKWMRKAEGKAAVDYGFHMIVTDLAPEGLEEMDALVAEGVTTFKLFMAYPGRLMVDDAVIFRALRRTADNGGLVLMHAENGGVIEELVRRARADGQTAPVWHARTRPASAEAEATHRSIALAELAGAPVYVVHVSCAEAADEIAAARARGAAVLGETCPQYLFLSDECYDAPGFEGAKYVMSPPLRPKAGQERLWRALAADDLQAVATDHCPFRMKDQKTIGRDDFSKIPGGAPGIETRMSLVYDGGVRAGRLSLSRFVEVTATSPAKLFGLYPRKGVIAPGSDADVVVWDPEREITWSAATHHMRVDYNPYEGRLTRGAPELVLSRGRPVIERGQFVGRAGAGQFLRRKPRTA
ncbi:MAG TPA: dihydropyrimidinase [Gemmatimonadales bacterium]|nr:dihydropyrimidinase [Gemmatimonadales bacterium]